MAGWECSARPFIFGGKRCTRQPSNLTIGNEVLAGDVLDTNSHWLCQQLAERGAHVIRITVLPDVVETIAEALRQALARHPALILTCGGLGPTADDLTSAAVAAALERPLAEDPTAYGMVRASGRSSTRARRHSRDDAGTRQDGPSARRRRTADQHRRRGSGDLVPRTSPP